MRTSHATRPWPPARDRAGRRLRGIEALTPRELQVAGLAAQGMSNREIAEALFMTLKTVEWHLRHSYEKLEIGSRKQLRAKLARPRPEGLRFLKPVCFFVSLGRTR